MNKIQNLLLFCLYVFFIFVIVKFTIETKNMTLIVETVNLQEWLDRQLSWESRNYVVTGNEEFKKKYSEYSSSAPEKWSELSYLSDFKKYDNYSLEKIYSMFSIYDNELKYLYDAQDVRKDLLWIETVSINMFEGYVDENDEAKSKFDESKTKTFIQFSKKGTKDMKKEAVNMLFSSDYLNKELMFTKLIRKGAESIFGRQQSLINTYKSLIFVVLVLILVANMYLFQTTGLKNKKV